MDTNRLFGETDSDLIWEQKKLKRALQTLHAESLAVHTRILTLKIKQTQIADELKRRGK